MFIVWYVSFRVSWFRFLCLERNWKFFSGVKVFSFLFHLILLVFVVFELFYFWFCSLYIYMTDKGRLNLIEFPFLWECDIFLVVVIGGWLMGMCGYEDSSPLWIFSWSVYRWNARTSLYMPSQFTFYSQMTKRMDQNIFECQLNM